jgi:hypothetical protein
MKATVSDKEVTTTYTNGLSHCRYIAMHYLSLSGLAMCAITKMAII